MLNPFLHFIHEKQLFLPAQKVLLAVSGGVDSVVMLDLFAQAKFNFAVAHCNFGLRGEDADGDEIFVQNLAEKAQVPFFSKRFFTKDYADAQGISTQMAARDLRYDWFREILRQENFDFLATAHHQNDNLETILLNLLRGTGIAGLRGVLAKSEQIIRPLLFTTRREIREYALKNQIQWREDYSNWENKYRRNLLRNELIPTLKKINPNLESSVESMAERLTAIENLFKIQIEDLKSKILKINDLAIFIQTDLLQIIPEPTIQLAEILKEYHFTYQQTKEIWASIEKESGKIFESIDYQLVKDRNQLVITSKTAKNGEEWEILAEQSELKTNLLDFKISQITDLQDFIIPKNPEIACLDWDKLTFPLQIRAWQAGDYFYPLGMTKRKKISDLLVDLKIPLNLKNRVLVLTSAGEIVWVIGHRLDNRFKITEKTKKILLIQ